MMFKIGVVVQGPEIWIGYIKKSDAKGKHDSPQFCRDTTMDWSINKQRIFKPKLPEEWAQSLGASIIFSCYLLNWLQCLIKLASFSAFLSMKLLFLDFVML
jgi:hypothetical protein